MMDVARKFVTHVIPGIVRPLRVLWNEVIGFFFIVLGIIFGVGAWRRFRAFSGDITEFFLLMGIGLFVLMLLGFGVSSFLRARKISRS
jgi:drug/metabolite transporter (DMT)-like permease